MLWNTLLLVALLSLPLMAGAFLVWFMMGGKGKPAPQTHEILEVKRQKNPTGPTE